MRTELLKKYIEWIAIWLFSCLFFYLQTPPVLGLDVCTDAGGQSMLIPAGNDAWKKFYFLVPGCQDVEYPLPSTVPSSLIWRLPLLEGRYTVRGAWVQTGWLRFPVSLAGMNPVRDIKSFQMEPDGLHLHLAPGAKAPKLEILSGRPRLMQLGLWLVSGSYASAFVILLVLALEPVGERFRRGGCVFWQRAKQFLDAENLNWKEFLLFFAIALVLLLYPLTNFSISLDDEKAALRTNPAVWLQEERWFAYLLEQYAFPQPVIPYIHHFLFACSLALSFMFLIRANHFPQDWRLYLGFAVFVSFPSWAFMTEYYANMPSLNVGIFLTSLAVFVFSRTHKLRPSSLFLWLGLQVFLLTIAIGGYQAYMAAYLTMAIGVLIARFSWDSNLFGWKHFFQAIGQIILVMGLSFVLYRLVLEFFIISLHAQSGEYIQTFWNPELFFQKFFTVASVFLQEAVAFYRGEVDLYGIPLVSLRLIASMVVFQVIRLAWFQAWRQKILFFLLWLFIFFSPFVLVLVVGDFVFARTLQALPFVVAFWSLFILYDGFQQVRSSQPVSMFSLLGFVLAVFLLFQNLNATNLYQARLFFVQEMDRSLAHQIYADLAAADPKFDRNRQVLVDFYGMPGFSSSSFVYTPLLDGAAVSFFDSDFEHVVEYMQWSGYSNIRLLPPEERKNFISFFQEMPAWPQPGYVCKVNGVYLVKLSDFPDSWHEELEKEYSP